MQINTDVPDIVALVMMIVVVTFLIYVVIYIHDIPYEIAKKRNHPHRDAIHIAGWVRKLTGFRLCQKKGITFYLDFMVHCNPGLTKHRCLVTLN